MIATNGLETAQWLLAIPLAMVAAMLAEGPARRFGAGLVVGSLVWIRPEGLLVGFVITVVDMWHHRQRWREPTAWALPVGAALPVIALFAWRWSTYGSLLPNTWAAKGNHTLRQLWRGHVDYLLMRDGPLWPLVVVLLGASTVRLGRHGLMVGAVGAAVLYPALQVYMWMPGTRLLLPLWILLASAGAVVIARMSLSRQRGAVVAAAVGGLLVWVTPLGRGTLAYNGRHTARIGNPVSQMAEWVGDVAPPGATVAIRDAGVFAHHVGTGVRVAETHPRALTVPHPDRRNTRVTDVLDGPPEFVVTTTYRADAKKLLYQQDRRVLRLGKYRRVARVRQHASRYYTLHARVDVSLPHSPMTFRWCRAANERPAGCSRV